MKAYYCYIASHIEELNLGEVVFAESRNGARVRFSSDWDLDYIDSRARRAEWADDLPRQGWNLAMTVENMELMRELGFWDNNIDGHCTECGLDAWTELPLSHVDDDEICGYCRRLE